MNVNPTTGTVSGSGETTENYYDQDGNVAASEDPNGVWTKTVYNDDGEVSAVYTTDGGGDNPFSPDGGNTILTTTYTRLATAPSSATGPLTTSDATVDYTADYYDSDDRQTDEADFGNNNDQVMSAPPPLADVPAPGADDDVLVTHTDYDADGNVQDTTDPTGTETYYTYDDLGNVTQEIDNYNPNINDGNPTAEANITADYTHDGDGDLLKVEQMMPAGQNDETTKYVYGTGPTAGDVVKTENPDPVTGDASSTATDDNETETYDNLGNVLSETDPDGEVQTFNYNALDQMTLDAITTLGADESGLIRATDYTYMPDGQSFQQADFSTPTANTIVDQTQDVYDGYGDETGQYDSQQGPVNTATTPETTDTPNADGDDTGTTDPLGDTDQDTYQGGTLTQTNQSGHDIPAQYNYDPDTGNLSSLNLYQSGTVGSGTPETTTWQYDETTGQVTNETFADLTQDNFTYNDKQQLSTETKPGETLTYGYDTAGDQTSSSTTDSITGTTVTDTSTYGSNGMLASVSQTTTGSQTASATNNFTYDDDGNVSAETQTGGVTTEYTYFGDGTNNPGAVESMKLINTSNSATLSETDYAYNSAQQLSSITVNGQTFTYGYQSGTNVISSVTSSGATTTFGYNPDTGNLTSINAGSGAYSASYSYNTNNQRASQIVSQTDSSGSTTSQNYTYTYDNANELATVTSGGSTLYSYTYDGTGNQTGTPMGTANSMNEYSAFTYNTRGDETNDGTYSYTWNANDQLIAVTANNNSVMDTFQYNGQGLRIEKDVYTWDSTANDGAGGWTLSSTSKFVYDGTNLVAVLDGDNNLVTAYTWGQNGLISVTDYTGETPVTYMTILDGNGNVVGLVNAGTGQVAATYTYDPYGKLLSATGPAAGVCSMLYGQGYYDQEVDLIYEQNRFYSPPQRRFLSQDPTGVAGGLNTFVYCTNDPINKNDPQGLTPQQAKAYLSSLPTNVQGGITTILQNVPGTGYVGESDLLPGERQYWPYLQKYQQLYDSLGLTTELTKSPFAQYGYCAACHGSINGQYVNVASGLDHRPIPSDQAKAIELANSVTGLNEAGQQAFALGAVIVVAVFALPALPEIGFAAFQFSFSTTGANLVSSVTVVATAYVIKAGVSSEEGRDAIAQFGPDAFLQLSDSAAGSISSLFQSAREGGLLPALFTTTDVAAENTASAASRISLPVLNPDIPAEWSVVQNGELITIRYGNLGTISGRGSAAYGRIANVAVHPTVQGTGLGTQLYGRLLPRIGNPLVIEGVPGGVNEAILETPGMTILDTPRAKTLSKFGYDVHTYNPKTLQMTSTRSGG